MPVSLVLYLDSPEPLPSEFLGREVQAWFLNVLRTLDPERSQELHDANAHKPYTVSDVFVLPESQKAAAPGPLLVRFTAFNTEYEDLLTGEFIRHLPEQMRLWYRTVNIRGYSFSAEESFWAGQYSYRRLAETAQALEDGEMVLEFVSPTAFRSNGKDIAEPIPAHVFRGCWQKWNAFAPPELRMHDDLPRFVHDCVIARGSDNIELQRIIFAQGKRGGAVGFTGSVNYAILREEFAGDWAEDLPGWAAQVRALAMFSFFCGVGHHTTVGLGQTFPRLLREDL